MKLLIKLSADHLANFRIKLWYKVLPTVRTAEFASAKKERMMKAKIIVALASI